MRPKCTAEVPGLFLSRAKEEGEQAHRAGWKVTRDSGQLCRTDCVGCVVSPPWEQLYLSDMQTEYSLFQGLKQVCLGEKGPHAQDTPVCRQVIWEKKTELGVCQAVRISLRVGVQACIQRSESARLQDEH